ncbi:hypothetical protein EDD36DRAFT_100921 [Exophiala viscosa]|uniref:Uncharacterized protein n=1 Tax=Exophiala viscosa TaxID=2486360 RepID=A0AAN6DNQ1_9EURO|nr:hypothetical protein EDD36DRAFT_100921 [Exophiala viscosa]
MASPSSQVPSGRSNSQSRRVQKSPNPSKKDKVRQGRLIRCWTDAEELFLIRSRNHKLPYKEIANRLEKSELACRLHHHHMTVGRKGHRVEDLDEDEDDSDVISRSPSTPPTQFEAGPSTQGSPRPGVGERRSLPVRNAGQSCTLPNFQSFIRDTFHHRSISSPDLTTNMVLSSPDPHGGKVPDLSRGARTLSGTFVKENKTARATHAPQRATVHLPLPPSQTNSYPFNDQANDLWDFQSGRAAGPRFAITTSPGAWTGDSVRFTALPDPYIAPTLHASYPPSREYGTLDYRDRRSEPYHQHFISKEEKSRSTKGNH